MNKERFFLGITISFLLICLLVLLWFYLDNKQKSTVIPTQSSSFPIETVKEQAVVLKQPYIGTVTAIQKVAILPYLNGYISEIRVKGGQTVKKGDVLFVLRQESFKAQKERAQAQVLSAEAAYNNASTYLQRIEKTPSQAISKTELDNAKAKFLSAEADLKAAKAELAVAVVNYDYTVIRASIDGIVGNIPVTPGEYVSPEGKPLAQIIQQTPIRVVFSISNKEYLDFLTDGKENVFDGWTMRLRLPNGLIYPHPGHLSYTDNTVADGTSSIAVYAEFDNPEGKLLQDGYVDVLLEKNISNGILLDKNLVHFEPDGAVVYLKINEQIIKQPVSVGATVGQQFYIADGLKTGDQVIVGTVPQSAFIQNQRKGG